MNAANKNPVRVGIIGLGRTGWNNHARTLKGMPGKYTIVAAADVIAERRREAAEAFACRTYPTDAEITNDRDVELLLVCSRTCDHPEHTVNGLRAGKHVVCEKPLAIRAPDADRMIAAATESGRVLTIYQQRRYEPDFLKVKEIVASGVLGRVVLIRRLVQGFRRRWDWQTLKEYHGGSLNNTGVHMLDQLLLFYGDAAPEVFCHMERVLTSGDAEDHVKVILRAPGKPMIDFEVTSACAYPQADSWLVMATRGGLAGDSKALRWKTADFSQLPERPVSTEPVGDRSYNREDIPWQEETWRVPEGLPGSSVRFYEDLYATLREGAPLAITPESVRRNVALLETCHRLCPV